MNGSFLDILTVNKGHYALESGLHGDVWFDLEIAYIHPQLLRFFTDRLATLLSEYDLSAICGALVGGAFVGYAVATKLGIDFLYTERYVSNANGIETVTYRLPKALRSAVANRKIGVVDDVINAGSAVTKTCKELRSLGANPVVIGSILTVGGDPPKRLTEEFPPVVFLEHLESGLWQPLECPLCNSGIQLTDPYETNVRSFVP
jgi:orotate phosphoribosyltransferase